MTVPKTFKTPLPSYGPSYGIGAAAALLLGAVVYVAMRDRVPAAVPDWLAATQPLEALRAIVPDSLTGPLPSFAHAAAVLLLTAIAAGRSRLVLPAMAVSTALCLALEMVQHPLVAGWLAARAWPEWLTSYAAYGTFSGYDLAGILLASVTLSWLVAARNQSAPASHRSD